MPASDIHEAAISKASFSVLLSVGLLVPVSPILPMRDIASKCCCSLAAFIFMIGL
jgi:hypothetical protein